MRSPSSNAKMCMFAIFEQIKQDKDFTLQYLPDKTSLSEMQKQFKWALNFGIKPDFNYDNVNYS